MTTTIELPARYKLQPRVGAPSATQVRATRDRAGLSRAQAAALVYVAVETWRNWEKTEGGARGMPAGLWELFLLKIGDIAPLLYAKPASERATFRQAAPPAPSAPPRPVFRRAP